MDKTLTDGDNVVPTEPYLRLAKHFENVSETYREVRLHGPANDAEAWKGVCEFHSRLIVKLF
jgi:hypothetical protein